MIIFDWIPHWSNFNGNLQLSRIAFHYNVFSQSKILATSYRCCVLCAVIIPIWICEKLTKWAKRNKLRAHKNKTKRNCWFVTRQNWKSQGTLAKHTHSQRENTRQQMRNEFIPKDFDRNAKPWTMMYAAGINDQQTPTEYITFVLCFWVSLSSFFFLYFSSVFFGFLE